jgi:hypothetical protein
LEHQSALYWSSASGSRRQAISLPAPQLFRGNRVLHGTLTTPAAQAAQQLGHTSGETLMLKSLLGAAAAVSLLGVVACSQGTQEEAGENADSAYEQSTTGTTDMGQGPQEEAGEAADATTTTPPAGDTTTTPPATTTP